MRNRLLILAVLLAGRAGAQTKLTVGQYAYIRQQQPVYTSPIVQYEGARKWYGEARYNYEEQHTFSLYTGHVFSGERGCSWSITPMAGAMVGKLRGGSIAVNTELEYKNMYFSGQSQYCVSAQDRAENFFFGWYETGYHATPWLDAGLSLQHTKSWHTPALTEPGLFACFLFHGWSFPVYCFLPSHEPGFFVAGITYEWKYPPASRNKTGKPVSPKRIKGVAY